LCGCDGGARQFVGIDLDDVADVPASRAPSAVLGLAIGIGNAKPTILTFVRVNFRSLVEPRPFA